jgi:AcrR family transcriptional regulator
MEMATRNGKTLLSRRDWARAALDAIGESGIGGVTVDELAGRLGATRGSFYWHFSDRDELIDEALELWASESTTERLPALEAINDPRKRLRALRRAVYEEPADAAELKLSCSGDDPVAARVFARVTTQRMSVLQRIFTDLGFSESDAANRAWLAYAFYLGHHQLRKNEEISAPGRERLERMLALLTVGAPRTRSHDER